MSDNGKIDGDIPSQSPEIMKQELDSLIIQRREECLDLFEKYVSVHVEDNDILQSLQEVVIQYGNRDGKPVNRKNFAAEALFCRMLKKACEKSPFSPNTDPTLEQIYIVLQFTEPKFTEQDFKEVQKLCLLDSEDLLQSEESRLVYTNLTKPIPD